MSTKDLLKGIDSNMKQFKIFAAKFEATPDKASAGRSRSYAKKLMKGLKAYVSASVKEEDLIKDRPAVEEASEPVVEEVAVEAEEEVMEDTSAWFGKEN